MILQGCRFGAVGRCIPAEEVYVEKLSLKKNEETKLKKKKKQVLSGMHHMGFCASLLGLPKGQFWF
jgi:hypothetical protein